MAHLLLDCNSCNRKNVKFDIMEQVRYDIDVFLCVCCPDCHEPYLVRMSHRHPPRFANDYSSPDHDPVGEGWMIERFWPEVPHLHWPDDVPDTIEAILRLARRDFFRPGLETTSTHHLRRALDLATKLQSDRADLSSRLLDLAERGLIPQRLVPLAAAMRCLREDAVFVRETIERQELLKLQRLTSIVLQYLFTLPTRIEAITSPTFPPP